MENEKMLQEQETEETKEGIVDIKEYMNIKLSKTYRLDGREISEIDLNGIEDLDGADMLAINRMMKSRGNVDASPEFTLEFAFFTAMKVTGYPLEFIQHLSMKDSIKVKMRVNYFLMY